MMSFDLLEPRRRRALPLAAVLALSLAGCENAREVLGLDRPPPDEFVVMSRAPLERPDDFGALPSPRAGLARPQEREPARRAVETLLGPRPARPGTPGTGEEALVEAAGPAPGDIRGRLAGDHAALTSDGGWFEGLRISRDVPDPTAVLVDPVKELRRLARNEALGLPANEGAFESAIVVPEEKALLEDLF